MKKKHPKFKVTNEVNRKIKDLCLTLPSVPFFMQRADGTFGSQQQKISRSISGAKLLEENPESKAGDGKEIDPKARYVQSGTTVRMMNHKVALIGQYQEHGDAGLIAYETYVRRTASNIQAQANKPNVPISAVPEPQKKDFGYIESTGPEEESHWSVDGGEEAYYAAMAEWEEIGKEKPIEVEIKAEPAKTEQDAEI